MTPEHTVTLPICERIGLKIRSLRESKEWSQRMLADHAGIEQAHLARLEQGKVEPGVILLEKIAQALEVEPADLLIVVQTKGLTFKPRSK